METTAADADWFSRRHQQLAANISGFFKGNPAVVKRALTCMYAEGHLLLDDVPGVGKTSLAKAIAHSVSGVVRRVQFTADLLPSDVTGVRIWDAGTRTFEFHHGPVFANVVLIDEINRASPKTQSALLEVMEERRVTVDSMSYLVPRPFMVVATQNPVEHGGTYELPEAQIDRFMMRSTVGYPDHAAEVEILSAGTRGAEPEDLAPVLTGEDLLRMTELARGVHIAAEVFDYIVMIVADTRRHPDQIRLGVSPRGGLALARAAQAWAVSAGRPFVTPDDVKALVPAVLGHRVIMRPEAALDGLASADVVARIAASVRVPDPFAAHGR
ncbi:MoxR family ATPase [Frankia sp. AiPs1]|uniref:AAA family ATPase n=1 Tax=Frankia sp. AiPs1 TaxID=573493 RepID=UPI002044AE2D|nr:MoxR family ATPase [Frankia sp. AiPs1]MCM3925605.1 MoxR family ATPase [Frankia sp. AiPs1]